MCGHILTTHFIGFERTVDVVNKANIDLSYASESLVCAVKDFCEDEASPLQQSTLNISAELNTLCNSISSLPPAAGKESNGSDLSILHTAGIDVRVVLLASLFGNTFID